ncbi:MAG: hypothetical protein ABI566_01505 [Pseudolysinimonas sp.]
MSDDTPTQRLPQPGDTPTDRIDLVSVDEDPHDEKQKSRGLLIGLIIAGVLLLIALIVLLFFLFGPKGDGGHEAIDTASPAPSATPEGSPSATPTAEPTQEPPTPVATMDGFTVSTPTVFCGKNGQPDQIDLGFEWSSSNGSQMFFGIDTDDASTAAFFSELPLDGTSATDFPSGYVPYQYVCGNQDVTYTMTVVDDRGHKSSKSVTVTDVNFNN